MISQARVQKWLVHAGLLALFVYTLGVENPHSTALRQSGFYLALVAAIVLGVTGRDRLRALARQPLTWALLLLTACAGLSVARSPSPSYSLWEVYRELGFMVLSAFATAIIVRRSRHATLLILSCVAAAVLISGHDLVQYAREFRTSTDWPSADIHKHRYYSDPLLWFLPAVLWTLAKATRRTAPIIGFAMLVYWLLIAGTGARAAWFGGACACALWFAAEFDGRRVLLAVVGLLVAIAVAMWILPPQIFLEQALRGIDSSHRLQGAWLPALELIQEQPWLGYGYGQKIFHAVYNAQVDANPQWYFRTSLGPHNTFLALWFAGGMPLIGSMLAALAAYAAIVVRVARRRLGSPQCRTLVILGACSVVGYLLVRGMYENVSLRVVGLAFGYALAVVTDAEVRARPAAQASSA